jgi:uncharacterized protein YndB with AHSA1/START domain
LRSRRLEEQIMTVQRSFKRLVRARMDKTGESYTAARAVLLAGREESEVSQTPALATSDAEIRRRTRRGWEEWFDVLDDWGAPQRSHREIARWIAEQLGVEPLAWNAQAVANSYERARGLRAIGEHADGFRISVTRTIGVSVQRLFAAWVDESLRSRWLPDAHMRVRTATAPRSARFDWGDGGSRVHIALDDKGETKSTVSVEHVRLADAQQAETAKAHRRERLDALRTLLERAGDDA